VPATDLTALMTDDLGTGGGNNITAMTLWSWSRVYGAPMDKVVMPQAEPVINRLTNLCIERWFDMFTRRGPTQALEKSFLRVHNLADQEPWRRLLEGKPRVHLIHPMEYRKLVGAISRATIVATDSGGLQEEAPCLGKPVLVLRRVTERPEGVAAGTLELVGTDETTIVNALDRLLDDGPAYERMARAANPYGDGKASARITAALWAYYRGGPAPTEFDPSLPPTLPSQGR
jgi:UDP-N-acetylglucosamine 2-epimerase